MYCPESARLHRTLLTELALPEPSGFPSRYLDGVMKTPEQFAKEYLAYNLVRKLEPYQKKDEVPVAVLKKSLEAFANAEFRCAVINNYGSMWSPTCKTQAAYFAEALRLTRLWISRTLMDHWPDWGAASYTGGASRNSSRSESMSCLKWIGYVERGKMSATALALRVVKTEIAPTFGPSWSDKGCEIVNDSRFDFVSKDAEVVRFMACEPEFNMLAQKCLGDCFRKALQDVGIDLDCQKRNRKLAHYGSVTGEVATLDQTSASDCIALLMANLLPKRFKEWVLDLRTPSTSPSGTIYKHKLQKIATMGNGFIFELQSLIFAGFSYACTSLSGGRESDVSVYGDDIVVSTCVSEDLMATLEFYGLMPNMKKSFFKADDPFRESCGMHYFAGRDVTPFYVKEPLKRLRARYRALNGLWYWMHRTGIPIPKTIKLLIGMIDKKDRIIVPPTYSIDSGIHFPVNDGILPERYLSHGQERYRFKYLARRAIDITDILCDKARYYRWLRQQGDELVPSSAWTTLFTRILLGQMLQGANVKRSPKVRGSTRLHPRDVLPGVPRDYVTYSCGGPQEEDHVQVNGNVGRDEIP